MELLLDLVEKRKLHISEVSLALVTDSYIEYLKKYEQGRPMGEMAGFILVASTLMLIKSLSLLPMMETTEEEKADIAELENRLKIYQKTKELSLIVRARFGRRVIYYPLAGQEIAPIFSPTSQLNTSNFLNTAKKLLADLPSAAELPRTIIKKILSLEEAIRDLTGRVQTAFHLSFKQFVADKKDKINIIVSFLGMLELVKQGIVAVRQDGHFADINIENCNPASVPRY